MGWLQPGVNAKLTHWLYVGAERTDLGPVAAECGHRVARIGQFESLGASPSPRSTQYIR